MEYTLDELVAAVGERIVAAGLAQANGQVSPFPDRRTLRYYTTIGLLGRPHAVRDRQAVYGEGHLSQALAVKRLQAEGLALAEIQSRLSGLPAAEVAAIADGRVVPADRRAARFWAARADSGAGPSGLAASGPAASGPAASGRARPMAAPTGPAPGAGRAAVGVTFGAPASSGATGAYGDGTSPELAPPGPIRAPVPYPGLPAAAAQPLLGISLAPDVTVLIPADRTLAADELAAIRHAAGPLLAHLAAAGLSGADPKDLP